METSPQFVAHGTILCQMCAHVMKLAKSFPYFGLHCVNFLVGKWHISKFIYLRGIPNRSIGTIRICFCCLFRINQNISQYHIQANYFYEMENPYPPDLAS